MDHRAPLRALLVVTLAAQASAQAPPGYYASVDSSTAASLRSTLHQVIDDHQRYPYTSSNTDTWDILEQAQQDPSNSNRIVDVYRNASYSKEGGGNSNYNREHTWPKSYGFPNDNSSNYPYTDCHVLFLCDGGYNSARSNKPFRNASSGDDEWSTVSNNGIGGGGGGFPGNSNWTYGSFTQGGWQVWRERKGDVARAMFYMDLRYEGGSHSSTGANEPNLILTNNESLIDSSNTGDNENVAYMGMLSVLLQWHAEDPPDDFERNANNVVYSYQGNRNPFIDHPEWVDCLFVDNCGGGGPGETGFIGSFCSGDGSATSCPCGNSGAAGRGCRNGIFVQGTELIPAGTASVTAADLRLDAFDTTPSSPGIFFQGTSQVASGQGTTFGDGLRCVGGQITRLEVAFADFFGNATTSIDLVARGAVQAGDTRYYQWWYRDTSGSPCGNEFNLSQGFEIVWEP